MTRILHDHLKAFGTAGDGRLFRNLTGVISRRVGHLPGLGQGPEGSVHTGEAYVSPLARRPYDLRHACVSTWFAAGVPSTQCAKWADHSVAVLHQIYAKVIAGVEAAAHQKIEKALGWTTETRGRIGGDHPDSAGDNRTEPGSP